MAGPEPAAELQLAPKGWIEKRQARIEAAPVAPAEPLFPSLDQLGLVSLEPGLRRG